MKDKYFEYENKKWPSPHYDKWQDLLIRIKLGQLISDDYNFIYDVLEAYSSLIKMTMGPRNKFIKTYKKVINKMNYRKNINKSQQIKNDTNWLENQIKKVYKNE
jgi:hypothetical protein